MERCPPPVRSGLASCADRLRLPLLSQAKCPIEQGQGRCLGFVAALRLHRLLGHELRPGEQRLLRLRGLVVVAVRP